MSRPTLPADLTTDERAAVLALARLADRWPKSLGIYSMASTLHVMREPTRTLPDGGLDPAGKVWSTHKIPNDGGDW